jgi:hypothetical protein
MTVDLNGRSRWPCGLRRGSAASHLLGLQVRIPQEPWFYASCECCVLSGRGLCVGPITRPEESYRVWCVWVWSWILDNEEALAHWGLLCHGKKLSWILWHFINFKFHCRLQLCHFVQTLLLMTKQFVGKRCDIALLFRQKTQKTNLYCFERNIKRSFKARLHPVAGHTDLEEE